MQILKERQRIKIDKQEIFERIGYCGNNSPPARIGSLVDNFTVNFPRLIEPSYSYLIRDIESVAGRQVNIGGSIVLESKVIARLLQRCQKVAVFVLTIDDTLEKMVDYLSENRQVLKATVLDAIGSCAAEQLAGMVQDVISDKAGIEGLDISRRFSPGYCDWNVRQQEMVFQAMEGKTAGVRLTDGCLMLPRKSVSGIIGLGNSDVADYNPCTTCFKPVCPGRRV